MVASVATKGYTATRVTDLIELSGVSRRSFYALFPDKEACFLAVLRELASASVALTEDIPGKGEERARRRFQALTDLVVAHPAAARLLMIEAFAVGPRAMKPLEEALRALERKMQAATAESPERAGMPAEMIGALIGGAVEVARTRLRRGTETELTELGPKLMDFLLAYRPPPQPLRLTTRPPSPAPETLAGHDHGERALRAFAVVVAERGYANTTIDQVVKRASMSPTTFYANFDGKEDAMRAAIDTAGAQIAAAVLPAFRRSADWAGGIRGAFGAFFNFLASHPALAHLLMVEVYAIGPEALQRREEALRSLYALLEGAQRGSPGDIPPVAVEAIFGGVSFLAYRQVSHSGAEALPALAPLSTYLALAPFVGAERACEVANGGGRARVTAEQPGEHDRESSQVLYALNRFERPAGVEEISRELEMPSREVEAHLLALVEAGLAKPMPRREEDDGEALYWIDMPLYVESEWEGMDQADRERISRHIGYLVLEDVTEAVRAKTFDRRPQRVLTRTGGRIDAQGLLELRDLFDKGLEASLEIQARSEERLRQKGERGFPFRTVQTVFEIPESDENP
jgi:AcrR family transcriptional regulator